MTDPEAIPISALQHWSYCPRQCALIHLEREFQENLHTARGRAVHRLVDQPGAERSGTVRLERAMPLWSERLGLIGKADLVEFDRSGTPYPVEYKHGPRRQNQHDDLQVAAQAMCLEEMTGRSVPTAAVFHFSSRRRREVHIDQHLRTSVERAVAAVRVLLHDSRLPAAVPDQRCTHCSLHEVCQPAATADRLRFRQLLDELDSP